VYCNIAFLPFSLARHHDLTRGAGPTFAANLGKAAPAPAAFALGAGFLFRLLAWLERTVLVFRQTSGRPELGIMAS
jgi:hypothetical protein